MILSQKKKKFFKVGNVWKTVRMHTHKHREKITWDISKIGRILDCKTWFSKLERIETIQRTSYTPPGHIHPKDSIFAEILAHLCSRLFITAMIMKPWGLYIIECYSSVKKKEIVKFAGKWMEQTNILSEVVQTQKDKCHMFSLICKSKFSIF